MGREVPLIEPQSCSPPFELVFGLKPPSSRTWPETGPSVDCPVIVVPSSTSKTTTHRDPTKDLIVMSLTKYIYIQSEEVRCIFVWGTALFTKEIIVVSLVGPFEGGRGSSFGRVHRTFPPLIQLLPTSALSTTPQAARRTHPAPTRSPVFRASYVLARTVGDGIRLPQPPQLAISRIRKGSLSLASFVDHESRVQQNKPQPATG